MQFLRTFITIFFLSNLGVMDGLKAQNKNQEPKPKPVLKIIELSINASNSISRFAGNANRLLEEDPYIFAAKFRLNSSPYAKHALRLGFNFEYNSKQEIQISSKTTITKRNYTPNLGYEYRIWLDKRLMCFFGADFRYIQKTETVETEFQFSQPTGNPFERTFVKGSELGFGAGPLVGFVYQFHPNFSVSTESSLTLITSEFERNITEKRVNQPEYTYPDLRKSRFAVLPIPPVAILLNVRF